MEQSPLRNEKADSTDSIGAPLKGFRNFVLGVLLFIVALCLVTPSISKPGGVLHGAKIWLRPYTSTLSRPGPDNHNMKSSEDGCDLHDPNEEPLPAVRTEFGDRATIVYGWPSTGGIWVHEKCYGVELDFLGVSRFEQSAIKRFSAEEDNFCKRLEWIGARYYESEYIYNSHRPDLQEPEVWVGWPGSIPEGGVWVLSAKGSEGAELGVSRIRNALTMKERCQAIKLLGGKFYKKWEDVTIQE